MTEMLTACWKDMNLHLNFSFLSLNEDDSMNSEDTISLRNVETLPSRSQFKFSTDGNDQNF